MIFGNINEMKPEREPDFVIGPDKENPYMRRWWLIPRNKDFNVYYHEILHDDDDRALHDHPWPSLSVLVKGRILEHIQDGPPRLLEQGDTVLRMPEMAHRLELVNGEPAETLFITGPVVREWGFHCPKGWIPWKEFTDPEDKGSVGRGCGET